MRWTTEGLGRWRHTASFREPLNDLDRHRLALEPDEQGEDHVAVDGDEDWTNPAGSITVSTCQGLIGLIGLRDSALLAGVELIGLPRRDLFRLIGYPSNHGSIFDIDYEVGVWSLSVGFGLDDDRVSWLFVQRGDLYDEPESKPE